MSIASHLKNLQQKHQQLKKFIKTTYNNFYNDTEVKILKKQKLLLKEKIQQLSQAEILK